MMSPTDEDLRLAVEVHDLALDCAVEIQSRCAEAESSKTLYLVARSALSSLFHESICLHRVVKDLSLLGWAFAAPILLRSMLDILCSMVVIVRNPQPDVAAFHFFYAWTKDEAIKSIPGANEQARRDIDGHFEQMLPEDRDAAVKWLKRPAKGSYWFSAFYRSPSKVIEEFLPRSGT